MSINHPKKQYTEQLEKKLYNRRVLLGMTYASETWTLTKALERRLTAAQRTMERVMIGVSQQDHRTNEWVRSKTKVCDIMQVIKNQKIETYIVARLQDNRWTSHGWQPTKRQTLKEMQG